MAAFVEVLGPSLAVKGGEEAEETAAVLAECTHVGIYFVAGSGACGEFTAKLAVAAAGPLNDEETKMHVVLVLLDDGADMAPLQEALKDVAWHSVPAGAEHVALVARFEATLESAPKLAVFDNEASLCCAEGVEKLAQDPESCEDFPWGEPEPKGLTEDQVLSRIVQGFEAEEQRWAFTPGKDEDGCISFFVNKKNFVRLGISNNLEKEEGKLFTGTSYKPYVEFEKQAALDEIKKMGFASDFHPGEGHLRKYTGASMLLVWDPKKSWGTSNNFVLVVSDKAYVREKARLKEIYDQIVQEHEDSLKPVGGGGGGGGVGGAEGADGGDVDVAAEDESIVVRDLPRICGEWKSPTMEETHATVLNFSVGDSRALVQVMITRPRSQFGKACKFSDSGENTHNCRPQKDPNFALQRRELEIGIQAVRDVRSSSCQTTWFRPVDKSTQYSPADFLLSGDDGSSTADQASKRVPGLWGHVEVEALTLFLSNVSVGVEEALQTNETVDIFQEEFSHLGEEEAGAVSKTHSNLRENRNFVDVAYTKGKRAEHVEWVPGSVDMLACSYCDNTAFSDRLDSAGKATVSNVLIWSFRDLLSPHVVLLSPWEVPVFKFYPSDGKYLIGGLSSGQLAVWKLSDADLGYVGRERTSGQKGANIGEEEKGAGGASQVPTVLHKQVSMIDESHKKAIVAIEWLPPALEIERRGRGAVEKNPKDGPVKYFLTLAGDGQVMIWDMQALLESINDTENVWRPLHKIQLQRQDSGTEMGCCQILYCQDRVDEKGNKMLTNFYASTEEGELILGDWAARAEEDRKPDVLKRMMTVSKSFRPMLSLERSPFFPSIMLAVTDWSFYLFKDDIKDNIFQSSYTSNYFTCGVWSPTRPSVIFLGLVNGGIDIWDFSDQSHKASLSDVGASVAIASMVFLKHSDINNPNQMLAVGDVHGHLHVHNLPKNLVKMAGKEKVNTRKFFEREEKRVLYFQERRTKLIEMKEKMEKQQDNAGEKADEEKGKATEGHGEAQDKADRQAEAMYQALEAECIEHLKSGGDEPPRGRL